MTNRFSNIRRALCAFLALAAFLTLSPLSSMAASTKVLLPEAGDVKYSGNGVTIDASHTDQGYVMISYNGSNPKVAIQITKGNGQTYTYYAKGGGVAEVFPFTQGSGGYAVKVLENVSGSKYALAFSKDIQVTLTDEKLPFLYPNQYVNFNTSGQVAKKADELTNGLKAPLDKLQAVYTFVIENFTYDTKFAEEVSAGQHKGYVPVLETVYKNKKGICFDYAAIMAAMLRLSGIPSKLTIGDVKNGSQVLYHAWISTYIDGVGWVDKAIYFDGKNWTLMDPTFAVSFKSSSKAAQFIGEGKNYKEKYLY